MLTVKALSRLGGHPGWSDFHLTHSHFVQCFMGGTRKCFQRGSNFDNILFLIFSFFFLFFFFFLMRGARIQITTKSGQSSVRQEKAIECAFCWQDDGGPTLNVICLVALYFRESGPVFRVGGPDSLSLYGSAHGGLFIHSRFKYKSRYYKQFYESNSLIKKISRAYNYMFTPHMPSCK